MHVKFQEPQAEHLSEDSDDHMEDCSEEQGQERLEKENNDNNTPPDATRNSMDAHSTSPDTTSEEGDFRVVRHSRAVRALTRKDIKERAWVKAS